MLTCRNNPVYGEGADIYNTCILLCSHQPLQVECVVYHMWSALLSIV